MPQQIPRTTKQEFAERRSRVIDAMREGSIAILPGGPKNRSHDKFRQTNNFYYLCGVEVPHAYLMLDGRDSKTTLFLPYQSETRASNEGALFSASSPAEAIDKTGVDAVRAVDEISGALENKKDIYIPMCQGEGAGMSWDTVQRGQQERFADPWDGLPDRMRNFVSLMRTRRPSANLRDLAPIMDDLRLIKSPGEISLLREAGRITGIAVAEAMKSTRPGVMEYEIDAILRYVYIVSGAREVGYRAIIAGGENAWYGHYDKNDDILKAGDLILLDCAPDYHYYTSDIGRMFPVDGVYTELQRQLYGYMVEYHKVFLELLGPGENAERIRVEASARMKKVVDSTHWQKPIYEEAARRALVFPHHLSHPVGMSVHDVSHYRDKERLETGTVLTVDPQMIIPEERRYVRVEDTVVITDDGIENFTESAPLELDDVEAMMKGDGMLQAFPAGGLGTIG